MAGHHRGGAILLVAQQARGVGAQQLPDFDCHGREQVAGVAALGDEGGDAAQSRLLVHQHSGVRDVVRRPEPVPLFRVRGRWWSAHRRR